LKQLDFYHRFVESPFAGSQKENNANKKSDLSLLTLLLLHGTGGNEDDLIPIGQMLSPTSSLISPRGKVLENGMPRFFKRLAEGVFDLEDLKLRTEDLARFVKDSSLAYSFDLKRTVAVGFSNGANIASSLLLLHPETLKGAVLFRGMPSIIPNTIPDLSDKLIFLSSGTEDTMVSKEATDNLFDLLNKAGAQVTLTWQKAGHGLTQKDIIDARNWLAKNFN